ncbi:Hypothetical protein, putative, partial [Bodo saltans]
MTPFLLAQDATAEAIDIVLRLEDVPSTPFIAAFTRTGKMFVMHRLTRQVEPTVAPINLESSVIAVASAERWNFGRSVPGLPAFASFLAVATASMRLHIISCRSFSVRVAHHLPEPVHALVYCGLRHVLFGGTTSGSVVMWAVSEKGFCTMLARWQCQPTPSLGSPVAGGGEEAASLSSYAMTPFLLAQDATAEAIDIVLRLEDVPSTPFIAAFTRTGKMFVMHRLTRQVEPTVAPINLESSVIAVASAERWNFGRSVPGLPAFASFLAVATASMRLHIISCRSFSVRVAHHLPEPVHALVYCGLRHVLFGGTTSGSVVMWAVSEKGFCTMLARWQCQPTPSLG